MQLILLLPTVFLSLFILYLLSKHDFVLLRQNISLAQIFDMGAIALFFAFLLSRLFYILNVGNFELLNILTFFHLFYYPGLSALGFLIGGGFSLCFLFRKKKSVRRIYDIFAIAFMPVFGFNLLIGGYPKDLFYVPILIAVILTVLFFFFLRSHHKYFLRDGSITFFLIFIVSLNTFVSQFYNPDRLKLIQELSSMQILGAILVFVSFVVFILNQKVFKT